MILVRTSLITCCFRLIIRTAGCIPTQPCETPRQCCVIPGADTYRAMGQSAPHGQFVHLYLNGAYWGVYELTERVDNAYGAAYFDGDKGDYEVIHNGELENGNIGIWQSLFQLADDPGFESETSYRRMDELLDLMSLIDFMILSLFVGQTDPRASDWVVLRNSTGGKFRFVVQDFEQSLRDADSGLSLLNEEQWDLPAGQSVAESPVAPYYLFRKLWRNAEFRIAFADRVHKHMYGDGALTTKATSQRWQQLMDELSEPLVAESARWGDYRRNVDSSQGEAADLYTRDDHWLPNAQELLDGFLASRLRNVLNQFQKEGLYPSIYAPWLGQNGGLIAPDSTLTILAPTGTIYYTTDGSDPREYGGAVSANATVQDQPIPLAKDVVIKARISTKASGVR